MKLKMHAIYRKIFFSFIKSERRKHGRQEIDILMWDSSEKLRHRNFLGSSFIKQVDMGSAGGNFLICSSQLVFFFKKSKDIPDKVL